MFSCHLILGVPSGSFCFTDMRELRRELTGTKITRAWPGIREEMTRHVHVKTGALGSWTVLLSIDAMATTSWAT